jgi:hypothetical protein
MNRNERGDLGGWAFVFIVIVFLAAIIYNNPRNSEVMGIEGGNIEKAIQDGQYK